MACYYRRQGSVKVTHIPSGESVISDATRSQHKNLALAMKVLRSRLWSAQNGVERSEVEVAVYEPSDEPWDE